MSISALGHSSATATGLGGLRTAQTRLDTAAHQVANAQSPEAPQQASLAGNLVEQRQALYSFAANLKTIETEDRMLGSLLDVQAR